MQTLAHPPERLQAPVTKGNIPAATRIGAALIENPTPDQLKIAFRYLDDLGHREAQIVADRLGGNPARILEAGYGCATVEFARRLRVTERFSGAMPHGLIILPCRDVQGQIVALHTAEMKWIASAPAVHIANPLRARFAEIQLCHTTSEADTIAIKGNVCAIARNGCGDSEVEAAVLAALRLGKADNPDTIKGAETVRTLARAA